jgi:hypothetical protein
MMRHILYIGLAAAACLLPGGPALAGHGAQEPVTMGTVVVTGERLEMACN